MPEDPRGALKLIKQPLFALHTHFRGTMKTQLTKRLAMSVKPREKIFEIRDIQIKGLLLRVHPSGHRAWVVEWSRGSRRTLGALSELSLDDARARAAEVMAEALKFGVPSLVKPKQEDVTLGDFLRDHYGPWVTKQLKWGEGAVSRILFAFPGLLPRTLVSIDQRMIDRWWADRLTVVSKRTGTPVGKVTASRELAALRSSFSKAVEWGFIEQNPLTKVRQKIVEAKKVVRYLAPDEERQLRTMLAKRDRKLIEARASGNEWSRRSGRDQLPELPVGGYGDHLTPIVLLAMNTGLRKGELLALMWSDINLTSGVLTIRAETAKSGKERHVPLNAESRDVLTRWRRQVDDGPLFAIGDFKTAWASFIRDTGIRNFRFHDLRHHFASRLVMNSIDLNTVRELLGHADLKMTLRYAHLAPAHLAAAVSTLDAI
jgi:integrase